MTENVFFFLDFLVYVTLADVYKMGKIGFKLFASNWRLQTQRQN